MSKQPAALQLRLLQTMVAVAAEKNSTLVLPFPVELLRFLERVQSRPETPGMPSSPDTPMASEETPQESGPDADVPPTDLSVPNTDAAPPSTDGASPPSAEEALPPAGVDTPPQSDKARDALAQTDPGEIEETKRTGGLPPTEPPRT
jgi:hypothetical protein